MRTARPYSTKGIPLIHGITRPTTAETTRATVLFVDLHGYDSLVEKLPPVQVVSLLEEFFGIVIGCVLERGGQVLHLSEADMMAGFGIGDSRHTQIHEAIAAACAIQDRFRPVRASWQTKHGIDAGVGVGIHRGDVAVGLFGAPEHTEIALVGDAAHIAVQLCMRARAGEVLLSSAAYPPRTNDPAAAGSVKPATLLHLPDLQLHGRGAPLDVWCIPLTGRLQMRRAANPSRGVKH